VPRIKVANKNLKKVNNSGCILSAIRFPKVKDPETKIEKASMEQ
jgi:hypothetical protein